MSEVVGPSGFWSYVHKDDERVNGRILRLPDRIKDEFALITGRELEIFVDRESLSWGDQWNLKINSALEETTFFIPVVTPSYFRSEACRKELLKFATFARSLGAEDLLLPILLVDVPGLSTESSDEAVALIAGTQYSDWRELRLTDEQSEQYGRAVNALAVRLAEIATEYEKRPSVLPAVVGGGPEAEGGGDHGSDEPGLADRLAALEDAMPRWVAVMEAFGPVLETINDIVDESTKRFQTEGSDSFAKRVNIARNMASALEGPAQEFLDKSNEYASTLLALDPGIRAFIVVAREQEEPEDIRQAEEAIEGLRELIATSKGNEVSFRSFVDVLKGPSRQFKDLRPPLAKMDNGLRSMLDAHTVMDEWLRLMDEPPEGSA